MLCLFTVLNKNTFDYWKENIHTFTSYFVKKDIDETIKIMFQYYSSSYPIGFYKIEIKAENEFIRLKWLETYQLYMYKGHQISFFFLLNSSVNETALKYLAYNIDKLEVSYDSVWNEFNTLIENDKMVKVTKQLDEIKELTVQNIIMLLDRGDRIEDLLTKSNELNNKSKLFKKNAQKLNSCCS